MPAKKGSPAKSSAHKDVLGSMLLMGSVVVSGFLGGLTLLLL